MQQTALGIAFQETMSGPFALGESDPQAGAQQGQAAGTSLTIHCAVAIDDLDRFAADPNHAGSISGSVVLSPFGAELTATSGVFNLFSPTDDPTLKVMVYELGFTHNGLDYYLAGHKNVRSGPPSDLWGATTTLYTQLHSGADRSGPVVGAGIITIDVDRLARLVASMRVTGAASVGDEASALYHFGRFFLGELWDTYGPGASHSSGTV
jgi:cholesterol oxidase